MGLVFKARHQQTGQVVAIKVVPPNMTKNDVVKKRFENEFKAASKLDHPNIIHGIETGMTNGRAYLVMEFVDGESLGQKIERDGPLPEAEAVRLIIQAGQALHYAHQQGLIHRDVKPDNLLITQEGQVKLADLGLVKELENDLNLTRTGRGLGTPHFMAPEQFRNAKNADVRCDVYSLGATLYQAVTGELPFKGSVGPLDALMKKMKDDLPPPRKLRPELSERTEEAIRRAMSADPSRRPASCQEFVEDLTGQSRPKTPAVEDSGVTLPAGDLWYLVYRDQAGQTHTVKGTTSVVRRKLVDGQLGDVSLVRACRTKLGPFEGLRHYAEFRDLIPSLSGQAQIATLPVEVPAYGPTPRESPRTPEESKKTPLPRQEARPHLDLEVSSSRTLEWVKLVVVALVAMGVGMLLFHLLLQH